MRNLGSRCLGSAGPYFRLENAINGHFADISVAQPLAEEQSRPGRCTRRMQMYLVARNEGHALSASRLLTPFPNKPIDRSVKMSGFTLILVGQRHGPCIYFATYPPPSPGSTFNHSTPTFQPSDYIPTTISQPREKKSYSDIPTSYLNMGARFDLPLPPSLADRCLLI
jgi:hypothetical protein